MTDDHNKTLEASAYIYPAVVMQYFERLHLLRTTSDLVAEETLATYRSYYESLEQEVPHIPTNVMPGVQVEGSKVEPVTGLRCPNATSNSSSQTSPALSTTTNTGHVETPLASDSDAKYLRFQSLLFCHSSPPFTKKIIKPLVQPSALPPTPTRLRQLCLYSSAINEPYLPGTPLQTQPVR